MSADQSNFALHAPERILLCLHPDHLGEFYYPLAEGQHPGCPHNGTHPVRVYRHAADLNREQAASDETRDA